MSNANQIPVLVLVKGKAKDFEDRLSETLLLCNVEKDNRERERNKPGFGVMQIY